MAGNFLLQLLEAETDCVKYHGTLRIVFAASWTPFGMVSGPHAMSDPLQVRRGHVRPSIKPLNGDLCFICPPSHLYPAVGAAKNIVGLEAAENPEPNPSSLEIFQSPNRKDMLKPESPKVSSLCFDDQRRTREGLWRTSIGGIAATERAGRMGKREIERGAAATLGHALRVM
jgi:hypothetical protein